MDNCLRMRALDAVFGFTKLLFPSILFFTYGMFFEHILWNNDRQ